MHLRISGFCTMKLYIMNSTSKCNGQLLAPFQCLLVLVQIKHQIQGGSGMYDVSICICVYECLLVKSLFVPYIFVCSCESTRLSWT